jgi:hypothetical protein
LPHEPDRSAPETPARRGLLGRLREELRRHAIGYAVVAAFTLIGPLLVYIIFPDASPLLGVLGGLAFGVYAALAAVPDRFLE